MPSDKILTCEAISPEEFSCKLGTTTWTVPMENTLFDFGSLNNLKSVTFKGKAKFRLYASKVELEATDDAEILCSHDPEENKLYCKAIGPYDAPYTEDYDSILVAPSFREPETPEERETLNAVWRESLSRFPPLQDQVGFMRVFVSPELDKRGAYAVTFFSLKEDKFRPITIFVSSKSVNQAMKSEEGKNLLLTDLIHELVHVYRSLSDEMEPDIAEDEAETYAEELLEDLDIRQELDVPTGIPEEGMLAPKCILPYCFRELEDVREFEKKNYEIMTGYEDWKPIPPGSPEWEEAAKRAPLTPIADVVRVYYNGYHREDSDVNEYWVVIRSPAGKKYAYHLTDLRVDDESLDFIEVIETVDRLNITKGEDIEVIKDVA